MEEKKKELLDKLCDYVVNMEDEEIEDLCREYLSYGFSADDGIMQGLVRGMAMAGDLYDQEEYYIAELLLCSDAMYNGINILKSGLDAKVESKEKIKAVIGVVQGDTHDIGKNLVKIMLETAGFEMIDLGRDVKHEDFIEAVRDNGAKLVCMSSLMTTTMYGMETVIEKLKESGLRDKVMVMVGGGPVTADFAEKIGADAYSTNAIEAVRVANRLFSTEM